MQVGILSYDKQGEMRQSQGIRLSNGSIIITDYDLLKNCQRAVVMEQSGTEYAVNKLAGANSLYNVCKITTEGQPKKFPQPKLIEDTLQVGDIVYILPAYNADKKAVAIVDTIQRVETFKQNYHYYTLSNAHSERLIGAGVLNADGQVVGILQAAAKTGGNACVMDVHFVMDLNITALNAKSTDVMTIDLPLQMPDKEDLASTFLFFVDKSNAARYVDYIEEFIERYPTNTTGYTTKSEWLISQGEYQHADSVYTAALQQNGIAKDELYYSRSKAVYEYCLAQHPQSYEPWTAEFALQEAQHAYAKKPLPTYMQQEANCHYLLKQYDEAYDKYMALTNTNMRTPNIFLYAAVCKQAMKADSDSILALMDSAVACFEKPYPTTAAPIILTRGKALADAKRHRDALKDFNEYEHLLAGKLHADFYYEREQIEVKCRAYPAALNDIERAVTMEPNEPLYAAEAAALNYRVAQYDDAIHYAEIALKMAPEYSDALRILGVCYKQKGNTAKAKEYLLKAKELGDELADDLLKGLK